MTGDPASGLAHCAPDAVWHPVTPLPGVMDALPVAQYFGELLPGWLQEYPDYTFEVVERSTFGDLVISKIRSNIGSGVMVFRVKDDKLTDIWALNNDGRDSTNGF
ncbi:MAG: nuclear transport factor 2 family protein [Acidimicrobiales bacterium]|nr:nuclear transport factor 2 family protein [Acidimicrobiales bacterium]